MSAAPRLRLVGGTLPTPPEFVSTIKASDELTQRRSIHELVTRLAGEKVGLQHEYRDAVLAAELCRAGDWRSLMSEAKKDVEKSRKQATAVSADARYSIGKDGCTYVSADDGPTMLANFTAQITAYVTLDDGVEQTSVARIRVTHATGRTGEIDVPAEKLRHVRDWAIEAIGLDAVVMSMSRSEEHALIATQLLSSDWERVTKYTCTGWAVIAGKHHFLTASGAIGAGGLDTSVQVDLGHDRLNRYSLPDPMVSNDDLRAAVRASLGLTRIGPAEVIAPLLGAAYRAPLPVAPETSVFAVGRSGSLKTATSAVVLQHFGAGLDHRNLPAAWTSTGNAIEAIAFQLANVLCVVDDYAPQSVDDPRKLAAMADRVMRGSANSSGRSRLRTDGRLRQTKAPRAQILATGEDVPDIYSLRARLTITEFGAGTVNLAVLTEAQQLGTDGTLAVAMAGYVRWLAAERDARPDYLSSLQQQMFDLRAASANSGHLRGPEAMAGLLAGWQEWVRYAVAIEAVTAGEGRAILKRAVDGLHAAARKQAVQGQGLSPAQIYTTALNAAIVGGYAHLADQQTNGHPAAIEPTRCGWRGNSDMHGVEWVPRGALIGWVSPDGDIFLHPASAYVVAAEQASRLKMNLGTTRTTLHKRLHEDECLAAVGKGRIEMQKRINGGMERVVHIKRELLLPSVEDGTA